jgi:hypothetical protein
MDFMTKVGLRMEGYTSDQIKALEIVWEAVPEPVTLVVTNDGYVYRDNLPVNASIEYGENFATADGVPVVILHPVSFGQYAPDEFYNEANLDAYRDQLFEATTADIRKKRLAEAAEQIAAQNIPVEPELPTMEECHSLYCADDLYLRCGFGRARLPLDKMRQCVCLQETCPHNPAAKPKDWRERRLEQARQNEEDSVTTALMQELVDTAKK